MIDFQVAYDKLAQFKDRRDLANFFRAEGITGKVRNPMSCPIANWMTQATGRTISSGVYTLFDEDIVASMPLISMTGVMTGFIIAFDNQQYPDLIVRD